MNGFLIMTAGLAMGPMSSSISVRGLDGSILHPLANLARPATVFFFIATDCPLSNGYAPEFHRIEKAFRSKGIRCYAVYEDTSLALAAARAHAKAYGYGTRGFVDSHEDLARKLGAKVTPQAVVLDRAGHVLYTGRVDDTYASITKRRGVTSSHDLIDALAQIVNGEKVKAPVTTAIGCAIAKGN